MGYFDSCKNVLIHQLQNISLLGKCLYLPSVYLKSSDVFVFCFLLLMLEKYCCLQEGELNIIFCTLQGFWTRSTSVRFDAGWESRCTPADLTYLFKLAAGVPATAGQRGGWGAWAHRGQWRISQLAHTHKLLTATERRLSPRSSPEMNGREGKNKLKQTNFEKELAVVTKSRLTQEALWGSSHRSKTPEADVHIHLHTKNSTCARIHTHTHT